MATPETALVTGASGFVGPYVVAALEARGLHVVGLAGPGGPPEAGPHNLPPAIAPAWRTLDLADRAAVEALIAEVKPTQVYHLAALSSVAASFQDPTPTYQTNVMGTLHLLDALRRHAPGARALVVSSAEVYGSPYRGPAAEAAVNALGTGEFLTNPLPETTPLAPASPYAASKAAAEMIAIQHHRAYGLHVVRARSFNHTGPGQTARFAVSAFARQIARIEVARQAPVLGVGNLAARRDFLDVRDVARAYLALVQLGAAGEVYNVCSGRAVALQALLDGLLALARVGIDVERDPALDRPVDVPELRGDPSRLQAATGWRPEIPLTQTLADVLAYWRAKEPFLGDAGPHLA